MWYKCSIKDNTFVTFTLKSVIIKIILFMPSLGSGYYVFFGNMTVSPLARLPAAHTPSENVKNLFCKATKRAKIFIL